MSDNGTLYFKYRVDSGEILYGGYCASVDLHLQAEDDTVAVIAVDADVYSTTTIGTHYLDDGKITPRPIMAIAQEGMTFTGLPPATTVRIEGAIYEVDDGEVELSFELPGTYWVRFESWPHQPADIEVAA